MIKFKRESNFNLIFPIIASLFFCLFRPACFAQKLTQDTLWVNFKPDTLANPQFTVVKVTDKRNEMEISSFDKRKFLFLPVDVFILPDHPFDSVLLTLQTQKKDQKNYALEIDDFYLSRRKGIFFTALVLDAKIGIFEQEKDSGHFTGYLYYQSDYKKNTLFEKFPESCENALKVWQKDFVRDMNTVAITGEQSRYIIPNFILEENTKDLFLNINVSGALGINWWLIDGELYFSSPEINRRTVYVANILRYQNHTDYESIAYGWKSEHLQYRLTNQLAFDGSGDILIGVNKWKNPDKTNPGLEQILNLNFSLTQTVAYKSGTNKIYGKFGVMENMIYIYEYGFKFYPGLYFSLGVKF